MINTKETYEKLYNEADDATTAAADMLSEYCGSTYICDAISERADSNIDIYNADLLEWAKYHLDDIEEANQEFGQVPDIIRQIQQAQFMVNERELYEGLESAIIIEAWRIASENAEEVTEEQAKAIDALDGEIDNNNRVEDIAEAVLGILTPEE